MTLEMSVFSERQQIDVYSIGSMADSSSQIPNIQFDCTNSTTPATSFNQFPKIVLSQPPIDVRIQYASQNLKA